MGRVAADSKARIDDHVQQSLAKLVDPRAAGALQDLCYRAEKSIDHAVQIARLLAAGRQIVVSLDLCELVDASEDLAATISPAAKRGRLPDRKVLVDVLASKRAIALIRSGRFRFTLLPGVAAEASAWLRASYVHAGRLRRLLSELPPPPSKVSEWSKAARQKLQHGKREKWIREDRQVLESSSHFVDLLQGLLASENYCSALAFPGGFELNKADLRDLELAIAARRPGHHSPLADQLDAVNLSFTARAATREMFICHMTRTVTLHNIAPGAWLKHEADVALVDGALRGPTLIHPNVITLLSLFGANAGGAGDTYLLAEDFKRHAATALSHIRSYAYCLEESKGFEPLRAQLESLGELRGRDRANSQLLSRFLNTLLEDLLIADQQAAVAPREGLLESRVQGELIQRRSAEALVAMQQRRLLTAMEVLGRTSGVASLEKMIGAVRGLTEAERSGFFLETVELANDLREYRLFSDGPASEGAAPSAPLLGVALSRGREERHFNLYWRTGIALSRFVEAAVRVLAVLERATLVAVWEDVDGVLQGESCTSAGSEAILMQIRKSLAETPAVAFQMACGALILTWESPQAGSEGYTSIRFGEAETTLARPCYEALSDELPWSLVQNLLTTISEEGDDGGPVQPRPTSEPN